MISDRLFYVAGRKGIPLMATFELSPLCNFQCKMCYIRATGENLMAQGKKLKLWTDWLELARQCKDAGTLYLLLTGGEPFLYPHFRELLSELTQMGFVIYINSNGSCIDADTIQWLKENPPARVNITLYGCSPETYGRVCGNKSGYQKAINAIRLLRKTGIAVTINASMIPENIEDLNGIIRFGKEHDLNTRVATYMFPPVRRPDGEKTVRLTPEQCASAFLEKQRGLLTSEAFRAFVDNSGECEIAPVQESGDECGSRMSCRAGKSTCWITWEGKMTACGLMSWPMEADVFASSFASCWQQIRDAVAGATVLKECKGCKYQKLCRPCAAMLLAETGDVNKKAQFLCQTADCLNNLLKQERARYRCKGE